MTHQHFDSRCWPQVLALATILLTAGTGLAGTSLAGVVEPAVEPLCPPHLGAHLVMATEVGSILIELDEDAAPHTVRRLVRDSGNPYLTGVCCINMDQHVTDEQIAAIFEEVESLREETAQ